MTFELNYETDRAGLQHTLSSGYSKIQYRYKVSGKLSIQMNIASQYPDHSVSEINMLRF